jgi:hypothetical protein
MDTVAETGDDAGFFRTTALDGRDDGEADPDRRVAARVTQPGQRPRRQRVTHA